MSITKFSSKWALLGWKQQLYWLDVQYWRTSACNHFQLSLWFRFYMEQIISQIQHEANGLPWKLLVLFIFFFHLLHILSLKIDVSTVCRQLVEATMWAVMHTFIFNTWFLSLPRQNDQGFSETVLVEHTVVFPFNKINLPEYVVVTLFVFQRFIFSTLFLMKTIKPSDFRHLLLPTIHWW